MKMDPTSRMCAFALMFLLQLTIWSTVFCQDTGDRGTVNGSEVVRALGLVHCNDWQCCPTYLRCCWLERSYKCCRGPSSMWNYSVVPCK